MDFATIEGNISKHNYKSVFDFHNDIEQVNFNL